jgi:hypothetical protein
MLTLLVPTLCSGRSPSRWSYSDPGTLTGLGERSYLLNPVKLTVEMETHVSTPSALLAKSSHANTRRTRGKKRFSR